MEVKIVFDNNNLNEKFIPGWGFSCLVDKTVLFDTGEKWEYLLKNMKNLDIDISKIEKVVISHDHWDHTGGLWGLLENTESLDVYACPGFSEEFKKKVVSLGGNLIPAEKFTAIKDGVFATGEIEGNYKGSFIAEQALLIKKNEGIIIITGCSHPGIVKIIKQVKENFPEERITFVFGGFHLMDKDIRETELIVGKFKELGVEKAGPTHCTGYEAQRIFKNEYKDNFINIAAGKTFEI
ncbi:MBL fold metallo-hydrolase [candidate division WOR-3 bacterium]|nr:MBL fold metallo-hydrolase [candidate division WOR-3 bacterium]